eukprot:11192920-Alexandrium_andersonii.AAC.1
MDTGALEPEPADADPETRELHAAFAVLQRMFQGQGRGRQARLPCASAGGAKGAGKGAFLGRCWKRNE